MFIKLPDEAIKHWAFPFRHRRNNKPELCGSEGGYKNGPSISINKKTMPGKKLKNLGSIRGIQTPGIPEVKVVIFKHINNGLIISKRGAILRL